MKTFFFIISGPLFLVSLAAHLYVRIRLRPTDPDLDEYYHEFEDRHPEYARYTKWLRITFAAIALSMLLLFVALAV
ncbi:MAG: hypothetical protein ACYTBJ_10780 [Planctomycetota bacterium]|jgi:hypothetical protein